MNLCVWRPVTVCANTAEVTACLTDDERVEQAIEIAERLAAQPFRFTDEERAEITRGVLKRMHE